MSYWPKGLSPKDYTTEQRQFIKINERVRQLEAVVSKLRGKKK